MLATFKMKKGSKKARKLKDSGLIEGHTIEEITDAFVALGKYTPRLVILNDDYLGYLEAELRHNESVVCINAAQFSADCDKQDVEGHSELNFKMQWDKVVMPLPRFDRLHIQGRLFALMAVDFVVTLDGGVIPDLRAGDHLCLDFKVVIS